MGTQRMFSEPHEAKNLSCFRLSIFFVSLPDMALLVSLCDSAFATSHGLVIPSSRKVVDVFVALAKHDNYVFQVLGAPTL